MLLQVRQHIVEHLQYLELSCTDWCVRINCKEVLFLNLKNCFEIHVRQVAVLLTDGNADRQSNAVASAQKLKDLGVTIFVIGESLDWPCSRLSVRLVVCLPACLPACPSVCLSRILFS